MTKSRVVNFHDFGLPKQTQIPILIYPQPFGSCCYINKLVSMFTNLLLYSQFCCCIYSRVAIFTKPCCYIYRLVAIFTVLLLHVYLQTYCYVVIFTIFLLQSRCCVYILVATVSLLCLQSCCYNLVAVFTVFILKFHLILLCSMSDLCCVYMYAIACHMLNRSATKKNHIHLKKTLTSENL